MCGTSCVPFNWLQKSDILEHISHCECIGITRKEKKIVKWISILSERRPKKNIPDWFHLALGIMN